jgi:hypothetical protein
VCREADELQLVAVGDHAERLEADRAGRAEDQDARAPLII